MSFIFGGSDTPDPLATFKPTGISTGGVTSSFKGGKINLTPSEERTGLISDLGSLFAQQGGLLGQLRESVGPGFNQFLETRLQGINDARERAIGNLRDNLARRRVLGSSFGQDTLSRAEAEFGRLSDEARADTFLKSLAVSQQLITQEFQARRGEFTTALDQMNLDAQIASKLSSDATGAMANIAKAQAALQAQEAQSAGTFWGGLLGSVATPIWNPIGSAIGTNLKTSLFG